MNKQISHSKESKAYSDARYENSVIKWIYVQGYPIVL